MHSWITAPASAAADAWGHHAGGRDVDFVVVGFGLGALGVLLGVVMLGWLAPRWQRAAARLSSPDDAARCQALAAEHRGTGQAFLYSGGAMLLATVAGLAGSLDDRTGAFLVTTTATVATVGILLAGYLQRARNPVPPRRRTRSAPAASASTGPTPPPDISSFLAEEPPRVQDPVPVESAVDDYDAEILPAGDSGAEVGITEDKAALLPAPGGAFSSDATDSEPLGDPPIPAEPPDTRSWQPSDHTSCNGSEDTLSAETEDAKTAGYGPPAAPSAESSPFRRDEEDPSSGQS